MLAIFGILAAAVVIAMLEAPALFKRRLFKELWIYLILLGIGTSVCIMLSLNMKLPNPIDLLTAIYKPFYVMLDKLLS